MDLRIFATDVPVNEALAAEKLDMACSGFALIYSLANGNCMWLLDINSTGGMGIYARTDSPMVRAGGNVSGFPNILGSAATVKDLEIPAWWMPLYRWEKWTSRKYCVLNIGGR